MVLESFTQGCIQKMIWGGGDPLYAALLIYGPFYSADGMKVRNLARWVYLYGRGEGGGGRPHRQMGMNGRDLKCLRERWGPTGGMWAWSKDVGWD